MNAKPTDVPPIRQRYDITPRVFVMWGAKARTDGVEWTGWGVWDEDAEECPIFRTLPAALAFAKDQAAHQSEDKAAEPTDAQPVAWLIEWSDKERHATVLPPSEWRKTFARDGKITPLYAHPPADAALPCDVMIAPATMFSRGVPLHTLLDAMARRRGMPDPETRFRPQSRSALAEQVRVLRRELALLERHVALNCFDQTDIDRDGSWLDKTKSQVLSELLAGAQDALAAIAPDGEAQG